MKTISDALKAHIQSGVTTVCSCITIKRRDGSVFCFTDHDEPVPYAGQVYVPFNSYARASISTGSKLEVDQTEITGILNSGALTREDISSGLFDFAECDVFLVNYMDLSMGDMPLRRGWLGEIAMNEDGTFHAEIRGLTQILTYRIGRPYGPECDADLGDRRCKIALDPPFWSAQTPFRVDDCVLAQITDATDFLEVTGPNAEFTGDTRGTTLTWPSFWAGNVGTPRGDLSYGGKFLITDKYNDLSVPPTGGYFALLGNDSTYNPYYWPTYTSISQTISLADAGLNMANVATGLCRASLVTYLACVDTHGKVQARLHAIDANGKRSTIWDSGYHTYALYRWITLVANDIIVPASTRFLVFEFFGSKKQKDDHGPVFGGYSLIINDPNGDYASASQTGGVMFQAKTAGVSGATKPPFTTQLDQTYSDGTVTWKSIRSYKDVTTVTSVTSNKVFGAVLPQLAGYYDGGLVVWETGKNAGHAMEVKTWASDTLTLFQRTFYPIAVGDRFVIHPGCDKRRNTCKLKFGNLVNFRGFPDVPGQDAYMQSPSYSSE